jgi:hypothetical protein
VMFNYLTQRGSQSSQRVYALTSGFRESGVSFRECAYAILRFTKIDAARCARG